MKDLIHITVMNFSKNQKSWKNPLVQRSQLGGIREQLRNTS